MNNKTFYTLVVLGVILYIFLMSTAYDYAIMLKHNPCDPDTVFINQKVFVEKIVKECPDPIMRKVTTDDTKSILTYEEMKEVRTFRPFVQQLIDALINYPELIKATDKEIHISNFELWYYLSSSIGDDVDIHLGVPNHMEFTEKERTIIWKCSKIYIDQNIINNSAILQHRMNKSRNRSLNESLKLQDMR